jgi:tetratricopeptide (TPR) repeat protein
LLGKEFFEPERSEASQAKLDSNLHVAQQHFDADPSEENYIWLGRRLAYLSKYAEAIEVFSNGIEQYPSSYRLYRHRGHRYISTRMFDDAIEDFKKAVDLMVGAPVEIEPDGQPNKINVPLSNTQFNVWYHLGLAYYLNWDFKNAEKAYLECIQVSDNDDLRCATTDWLYMTYRRLDQKAKADDLLEGITAEMEIVENDSYYERLMMYKGLRNPEEVLNIGPDNPDPDLALATQGYGVGNWYLYNNDTTKAKEIFEMVVAGRHFSAFGFIAAESDLYRLRDNE